MDIRHTYAGRISPRVPVPSPEALAQPEPQLEIMDPSRVVERNADATSSSASQTSCPGGDGSGKCQTGVGSSTFTLPIVLGIV